MSEPTIPTQPGADATPAPQPGAAPAPQPPPQNVLGQGGKVLPEHVLSARLKYAEQKGAQLAEQRLRQQMKEKHGVEDFDSHFAQHKSIAEEHKALKEAEEERKRASMSKEEALNADLAQLRAENEALKAENEQLKQGRIKADQSQQISSIASKYLKDKFVRTAVEFAFLEHVKGLDEKAVKAVDQQYMNRWFRTYARENPELARSNETDEEAAAADVAKKAEEDKAKVQARPIVRRPITNGAAPKAPPPANGPMGGKTARPGQPNSMNKAEVREWARANGYKYPG